MAEAASSQRVGQRAWDHKGEQALKYYSETQYYNQDQGDSGIFIILLFYYSNFEV